jgi:hypothetical protein
MKRSRPARFFVTWLTLASLAFAQLAMAAYACPGVEAMGQAVQAAEPMPDCHKAPDSEPIDALCKAHCQQADQSVDRLAVSAAAVLPSASLPLRIAASLEDAPSAVILASLLERPTEPPAAVRHCRLHI